MTKKAMKIALKVLKSATPKYARQPKDKSELGGYLEYWKLQQHQLGSAIQALEEALAKQEQRNVTKDEHDVLMKALAKSGKVVDAGFLAKQEQDGNVCARCGGIVFDPVIKQEQGEPVAWQERQARRMQDGVVTEWTNWYPCRYRTIDEAQAEACDHIPYEWRPLYTTPQQNLRGSLDYGESVAKVGHLPETLTNKLGLPLSTPLYTTPYVATQRQQRPSRSDIKPLTDEQITKIWEKRPYFNDFARAIEAAHGIKE
jgi:hypothetical protein